MHCLLLLIWWHQTRASMRCRFQDISCSWLARRFRVFLKRTDLRLVGASLLDNVPANADDGSFCVADKLLELYTSRFTQISRHAAMHAM